MGSFIANFTISLDGYIAGPGDDIRHLFRWYFAGDVEFPAGGDRVFRISQASADLLGEVWPSLGSIVTGRRDFDVSKAWGGNALMNLPTFIVTHHPPQEWMHDGSPFTFVSDGIESAFRQAKQAAGDKNIGVGGSQIVQQALNLGLIDEIHLDLVPVLIGSGIRLFDNLIRMPINLISSRVVNGEGVTHLAYRVVK